MMQAPIAQEGRQPRRAPFTFTVLVAMAALLCSATASAKWFATPEFAEPGSRPQRLLIAPTEAIFFKEKVLLKEEMVKEARVLEDGVGEALKKLLTEKGYEVVMPTIAEINADGELQSLFGDARRRFNNELISITHKPKGVKYRRFEVGDTARLLADHYKVDAIVYPRMLAEGIGAGKMAMAVIFGVGTGYSRMDFGIVDGGTGIVTAYYWQVLAGIGFKQLTVKAADTTEKLTNLTLKKYPVPKKKLKIRISEDELREIEAAPDENEDEVLAELEALLAE